MDGLEVLSIIVHLLTNVPDKLATERNFEMGWAHNYSLPRELTVANDGSLQQKPYSGLEAMRTETAYAKETGLIGSESLAPVSGQQIELLGEFTLVSGTCGFRFLKSGDKQASLAYDADKGTLTLDLTSLDREVNDSNPYAGVYTTTLPKKVALGEKLKLHLFLDGSIADIFVNDTWAFSARIFPKDAEATQAEVFATAEMQAKVSAWTLDPKRGTTDGISQIVNSKSVNSKCYSLQGHAVSQTHKGICILNGKKVVKK